jgi:hypothetical protein
MRKPYKRPTKEQSSLVPVPPPEAEEEKKQGFSLFRRPKTEIQTADFDALDHYAENKNLELTELKVTEKRKVSRVVVDDPKSERAGGVVGFFRNMLGVGLAAFIVYFSLNGLSSDNPWEIAAGMNMALMLSCVGPLAVGGLVMGAMGYKPQANGTREDTSYTVRRSYTKKRK